jgi:Ni,Fe-hydrogenase I cytochrome b subunit
MQYRTSDRDAIVAYYMLIFFFFQPTCGDKTDVQLHQHPMI